MHSTRDENVDTPILVKDALSARDWLAKMVSFDTTSSKSNIPFIEYLAAYCREVLKAAPGAPPSTGARVLVEHGPPQEGVHYANLVVSLLASPPVASGGGGEGVGAPEFVGGFALSGHSDVVPVDGQAWDTDPFTMVEKDGKLYGRGTCDMKGFLAVIFSLLPEWAEAMRGGRFRKPLHIILTYSEETDLAGCLQLLRDGSEAWGRLHACEGVMIGEPTMMEVIIAHKGIHENYVTCRGTAAHSSLQTAGFNAVEPATAVLRYLFDLRDRFAREGPFDDGFEIPYTTFCPGKLVGGQAINTIPEHCTFAYQFRNVPGHHPDVVERDIQAFIHTENARVQAAVRDMNDALAKRAEVRRQAQGGAAVEVAPVVAASVELGAFFSSPHFEGNADTAMVKALQRAVVDDAAVHGGAGSATDKDGAPTVGRELKKVSFYTEAGEFQSKGLNTVVCGPGSIEQAHKANEFVTIEQLEMCVRVVRKVVEDLCF